jgi:hypothetical protein
MQCTQVEELISARIDGEITREEEQTIEVHLADCPTCTEIADGLSSAQAFLDTMPRRNTTAPPPQQAKAGTLLPWIAIGVTAAALLLTFLLPRTPSAPEQPAVARNTDSVGVVFSTPTSDRLNEVIATERGYIAIGRDSVAGAEDLWIGELSDEMELVRQINLGTPEVDLVTDAARLPSGNIVIIGRTQEAGDARHSDFLILLLSSELDVLWSNALGGPGHDLPMQVIPWQDGFLIAGITHPYFNPEGTQVSTVDGEYHTLWLMHFGEDGNSRWQRSRALIQEPDSLRGRLPSPRISGTGDGGFIITSGTDYGRGVNTWVARYDASAELLWERVLDLPSFNLPLCITQTSNGDMVVGGSQQFQDRSVHGFLARLDPNGNARWIETVSFFGENGVSRVVERTDGRLLTVHTLYIGKEIRYRPIPVVIHEADGSLYGETYFERVDHMLFNWSNCLVEGETVTLAGSGRHAEDTDPYSFIYRFRLTEFFSPVEAEWAFGVHPHDNVLIPVETTVMTTHVPIRRFPVENRPGTAVRSTPEWLRR